MTPEEYKVKKAAWEKTKPPLFTIEIWFQPWYTEKGDPAKELERWFIHNQLWNEVRGFRESVFTHGFFLERSPGRGEIIFPADFRKILIDIQKTWKDEV